MSPGNAKAFGRFQTKSSRLLLPPLLSPSVQRRSKSLSESGTIPQTKFMAKDTQTRGRPLELMDSVDQAQGAPLSSGGLFCPVRTPLLKIPGVNTPACWHTQHNGATKTQLRTARLEVGKVLLENVRVE